MNEPDQNPHTEHGGTPPPHVSARTATIVIVLLTIAFIRVQNRVERAEEGR